jgi:Tfp pilus assembly protein PilN
MFFHNRLTGGNETNSLVTLGGSQALFTIRKSHRPEITVEPFDGAGGHALDSRIAACVIMRSPKVFLKLTQTPVMPKRELLSSIRYTERDTAPFNLDTALADAWVMDGENGPLKMNSLIVAIPEDAEKERLDNAVSGKSVTVVPAAIRALLIHAASLRTTAPALFIHLCDEGFGVYAFSGGNMVFMREMAMPAPLDESGFHKTLAEEIARSASFLARTSGITSESVWLLGPEAQDGLPELISSALGMDVKVYDPARDFAIRFAGLRNIPKSSLAVMIGAALDGGKTINIPSRKPVATRFIKKPALAGALIAAVALFCVGLASLLVLKIMDARIVTLEAQIGGMRKTGLNHEKAVGAIAKIEAENAALKSRIEAFEKVAVAPRPGLRGALAFLAANSPENVALTRFQVNIPTIGRQDSVSSPASVASRRNTRIEGIARGSEAEMTAGVSALISTLSGSPLFSSVTLSRLRKETAGSASAGMTSFEIVADLASSGISG